MYMLYYVYIMLNSMCMAYYHVNYCKAARPLVYCQIKYSIIIKHSKITESGHRNYCIHAFWALSDQNIESNEFILGKHYPIRTYMSLTCCIKSHCTPATLTPAHTPCLFSIDLHTVRQHLVIVHFLLLLLLSGTLFQMMSGVPHHCHHLSLA